MERRLKLRARKPSMASLTPATMNTTKAAADWPEIISQTISGTRTNLPMVIRLGIVTSRALLHAPAAGRANATRHGTIGRRGQGAERAGGRWPQASCFPIPFHGLGCQRSEAFESMTNAPRRPGVGLCRCRRRYRRRKCPCRGDQAARAGHEAARRRRRNRRFRRPVRPESRRIPRSGAGRRHRRRRHQAQDRHRHRHPRHGRHRPRRHVRQRPRGPGRRAAVLPRLFRHRQARPGGRGANRLGHRRGLPPGRRGADRRRDRRDARHVCGQGFRPRRLRRRRRRARRHFAARRHRGRRRGAGARLLRHPLQRLLAGAQARRRCRARLRRTGALRQWHVPRPRPAGADPHLCEAAAGRGAPDRRGEGDGPHHRRRHHREPAARAAGEPRRAHRPRQAAGAAGLPLAGRARRYRPGRDAAHLQLRRRHDAGRPVGLRRRGDGGAHRIRRDGGRRRRNRRA